MNKARRKQIDDIIKRIEDELGPMIESIKEDIETVRDEEQEVYDNMPESFQSGEKGELASAAIEALEEALSPFDELDTDSIIGSLNTAQE